MGSKIRKIASIEKGLEDFLKALNEKEINHAIGKTKDWAARTMKNLLMVTLALAEKLFVLILIFFLFGTGVPFTRTSAWKSASLETGKGLSSNLRLWACRYLSLFPFLQNLSFEIKQIKN